MDLDDVRQDGHPGIPLRRLVDTLGPGLVDLVVDAAHEIVVCDAILYDARAEDVVERGDLVLAVGLDPTAPELEALLRRAAAANASAVAVKRAFLRDDAIRDPAVQRGIPVLGVADEANWAHVLRLVQNVVGADVQNELATASDIADLFTLADSLAAMVEADVLIEDPSLRVLAYSRSDHDVDRARRMAILQRRCPEDCLQAFQEQHVLQAIRTSDAVVRVRPVPEIGLGPRLVVGVHSGGELLGSLWVAGSGRPLDERMERQLRIAAQISALHLAQHRAHELADHMQREAALRDLLDGRASAAMVADTLNLDVRDNAAVLSGAVIEAEPGTEGRLTRRLQDVVTVRCLAHRHGVVSTTQGGRLRVLFTGLEPSSKADTQLTHLAQEIAADAKRRGLRCVLGLGPVVPDLHDVRLSAVEADRVLAVLRRTAAKGSVARVPDVWGHLTVDAVCHAAGEELKSWTAPLSRLLEHDQRHHTDYVITVRAFLDSMGDVRRAARSLNIHPNTFRYRLRRVAQLGGLDLDDPVERLALSLQLHHMDTPPGG
ncbi:MAG: hypothetical protein GEV03_14760 [Streptosporangiales bacterium]|nr:hypothetical protein [Streptosporangiales bacterium]